MRLVAFFSPVLLVGRLPPFFAADFFAARFFFAGTPLNLPSLTLRAMRLFVRFLNNDEEDFISGADRFH